MRLQLVYSTVKCFRLLRHVAFFICHLVDSAAILNRDNVSSTLLSCK